MESTHTEPAPDGASADDVRPAHFDTTSDEGPAPATSVGVWGPSGMGKTQLALTLLTDPGYTPAMYVDLDGGRPAAAGYEAADLLVHRPATTIADVIKHVREVQTGRAVNRAGQKVRSVIIDAVSCLVTNEIKARVLVDSKPMEQAQAIGQPFKVFFGQLRSLHKDYGITVVEVCHSKTKTVKVGEVPHDIMLPDMFRSVAQPWMASVRHLWRVTKTRGAKGPAFPIMMLRTEQEGVVNTANFVEYMKTSNIAFAQWIAGEAGKREHLQWDTGVLPPNEHPTLANLLRVADELAAAQGQYGVSNPAAMRALSVLQAAMSAADAS